VRTVLIFISDTTTVHISDTLYFVNRFFLSILRSFMQFFVILLISALEVFLKRYALYKFTFYLLTYIPDVPDGTRQDPWTRPRRDPSRDFAWDVWWKPL